MFVQKLKEYFNKSFFKIEKFLFKSSAHFLIEFFVFFFTLSCMFFVCVFCILTPFKISFSNKFSHSISCLFILLIVALRYFPREDKYMVNSHMKRYSTSAIIRNIQTCKEIPPHTCQNCYHKKRTNNKYWQNVVKRKPLCTVGGIVNWCSHYGKKYGCSSEN